MGKLCIVRPAANAFVNVRSTPGSRGMSKVIKKCQICNNNITLKRDRGLSCVECGLWYHGHQRCSGLTTDKFDELLQETVPRWCCEPCTKAKKSRRSTISVPSSSAKEKSTPIVTNEECLRRIEELEKHLKEEREKVNGLEQQIEELRQKFSEANASSVESTSQNSVENYLEIRNLPQNSLTNPKATALKIGSSISCEIEEEEVECSVDSAVLSLKFTSRETRRRFLRAGKKFNREGGKILFDDREQKIFVNEKLTQAQKILHYKASRISRSHGFKFCWWSNGSLLLKETELHMPITIRDEQQLDQIFPQSQNILPKRPRPEFKDSASQTRGG